MNDLPSGDERITQFLSLLRSKQIGHALALLEEHPMLAASSIHVAAGVADVGAVAAFLAADPASATRASVPDGIDPIIFAVQPELKQRLGVDEATQVEVVRALLDAGASANASVPLPDISARIPALYFPCDANVVGVARLLLERGANPNDGESLYHAAQHDHRACLDLLVAHGANTSGCHPTTFNTPLYFLATHRASNGMIGTVIRGMAWLLEHGADPNIRSFDRDQPDGTPGISETPLHRAAASGLGADVMQMLVEHGAIVDMPRGDGRTAYMLAVRVGNTDAAAYLASRGAVTASLMPVDRLLAACAIADEVAARDVMATHPGILSTVLREDRQQLGIAISDHHDASVRLMVVLGWPLDEEGEWGGTPLHWAAWHGNVALVTDLLHAGAPINMRDTRYGSAPIAWASHGSRYAEHDNDADYVAITTLLLDAGATRAESFNQWGESPESMATPAVATLLKDRGFAG